MSIGNSNLSSLSPTAIPAIERLYGGRYRVSRYFVSLDKDRAFPSSIESNYFDEFGALDGVTEAGIPSGLESGANFPNCKLVSQEITYFPNDPLRRAVLHKVYETLTNTLVDEQAPVTSVGVDGGTTVDQTLVGDATAPFTGTVGVTTHPDDPTLILASYKETIVNGKKTVVVRWEKGPILLSESRTAVSEGVFRHDYVWKYAEGTVAGNVVSRSTQNVEGFPVITVSSLENESGEPLTEGDGSAKLANRRKVESMFRVPGTIRIEISPNVNRLAFNHTLTSPVETKVLSDVLVYYQKGNSVVPGDYLLDGAQGAWNPTDWASTKAIIYSAGAPYFNVQSMRGYTSFQQFIASDFLVTASAAAGNIPITEINLSPNLAPVGSGYYAFGTFPYLYDYVTLSYDYGGGQTGTELKVVGKVIEFILREDAGMWKFEYKDAYQGPVFSYTVGGTLVGIDSVRNGAVSSYNSPTSGAITSIDTSTNATNPPWDSTWTTIHLTPPVHGQSYTVQGGGSINANVIALDTVGYIGVSGGPEWPVGKRYVTGVEVDRAFEDIDTGDIIYRKSVMVTTVSPV